MRAERYEDTDWPQIAALYEVLMRIHPSPVIELNHAVAVAMVDGPERALRLVELIGKRGQLNGYHVLPAVRGDLLRRLGRRDEAIAAYRQALDSVALEPERRFLAARLAGMDWTLKKYLRRCVEIATRRSTGSGGGYRARRAASRIDDLRTKQGGLS